MKANVFLAAALAACLCLSACSRQQSNSGSSADEISSSGAEAQNLSVTIYSMVKRRVTPEINALSTLIFGTVLVLLILVNVLQIRDKSRTQHTRR